MITNSINAKPYEGGWKDEKTKALLQVSLQDTHFILHMNVS